MQQVFETPRLRACVLDVTGAKQYLAYEKENREAFREFSIARNDSYFTLASFEDVCLRQAALFEQKRKLPLVFIPKKGSRFVATVSLNEIAYGVFRSCTIGYSVAKAFQGQGYGKEAVGKTVEHAFSQLKLHRIEANIIPRNEASLGLAKSLGFEPEGLAKEYLYINGKWEDHLHLVLLNRSLLMQEIH